MADLISREAAIELFTRKENEFVAKFRPSIRPSFAQSIARVLAKLPTIDAVEVVRCKDCEDYENEECVCPYIWTSDGAHIWPDADHFCSYGKRRE